jgi:hypothetical protein
VLLKGCAQTIAISRPRQPAYKQLHSDLHGGPASTAGPKLNAPHGPGWGLSAQGGRLPGSGGSSLCSLGWVLLAGDQVECRASRNSCANDRA